MKPPVSLGYLIAVMLLALASAALSYVSPSPAFNLAALLLGVYALHLVSLRVVMRDYLSSGHWSKHLRGKHLAEVRAAREELDVERRDLDNRKVELDQRIAAAEQQWDLLRQMIRERVEGGRSEKPKLTMETGGDWKPSARSESRGAGVSDETPRINGRW